MQWNCLILLWNSSLKRHVIKQMLNNPVTNNPVMNNPVMDVDPELRVQVSPNIV